MAEKPLIVELVAEEDATIQDKSKRTEAIEERCAEKLMKGLESKDERIRKVLPWLLDESRTCINLGSETEDEPPKELQYGDDTRAAVKDRIKRYIVRWGESFNRGVTRQGVALYPVYSLINHSCLPHCGAFSIGDLLFLSALIDIKKGTEISISYQPQFPENFCEGTNIGPMMRDTWLFDCECEFSRWASGPAGSDAFKDVVELYDTFVQRRKDRQAFEEKVREVEAKARDSSQKLMDPSGHEVFPTLGFLSSLQMIDEIREGKLAETKQRAEDKFGAAVPMHTAMRVLWLPYLLQTLIFEIQMLPEETETDSDSAPVLRELQDEAIRIAMTGLGQCKKLAARWHRMVMAKRSRMDAISDACSPIDQGCDDSSATVFIDFS